MSDIRIKMILFTLGILLFSCGLYPSIVRIFPDFSLNFFEVGIIGTVIYLGTGYLLNFLQKQFFDKKNVDNTAVLDQDDKNYGRVSDNKLWPYKLGLIFSAIMVFWFLWISYSEF